MKRGRSREHENGRSRSPAAANHDAPEDARVSELAAIRRHLQGAVGNSELQRLYEGGGLQASLRVGAREELLEREAERVAEEVTHPNTKEEPDRQPAPASSERHATAKEPTVPATRSGLEPASAENPGRRDGVSFKLDAVTGGGRPLDPATRSKVESRFGHDFGDVRIHTGAAANQAARTIDAEAFTVGHDIAFASGNYQPGTRTGMHLLAHELTHVVQQQPESPSIQRQDTRSPAQAGPGSFFGPLTQQEVSRLSDDEVSTAIHWNDDRFASHGYVYARWLQANVGMSELGWAGDDKREQFVREIADFQDEHGLRVDGMVGPKTLRELYYEGANVSGTEFSDPERYKTTLIRVIPLALDMPMEGLHNGLRSIQFKKDLDPIARTEPITPDNIPCDSKVLVSEEAFVSYELLAHSIRHELQHVTQIRRGMDPEESKPLMEFLAEYGEILGGLSGAPVYPKSFKRKMSDAHRALHYWKKLDKSDKAEHRDKFLRISEKVQNQYQAALVTGEFYGLDEDLRDEIEQTVEEYRELGKTLPFPTDDDKEDGGSSYEKYEVEKGDTLWDIAERKLGQGRKWRAIFQKTNNVAEEESQIEKIDDPNRIYPDQVLAIPKGS